jgi:hypothetical protein
LADLRLILVPGYGMIYKAMMKQFFTILFLGFVQMAFSQQSKSKADKPGMLYFSLGSHRAFYTPSTTRFVSKSRDFDFTLEKLRGSDDGGVKLRSSPQYSYNFGYYSFKHNLGIEYQFDHVKYIMRPNQVARLKGQINEEQFDRDTLVHKDFVQLEHTDGANYAMINLVKWKNLAKSRNQKRSLDLIMKAGAGIVVPKTNTTIMGEHYDDRYAVSGYVIGIEPGLRYNFLKNAFLSGTFKGAYANYTHFRIAEGWGKQKWFSAQFNLMLGVQLPL